MRSVVAAATLLVCVRDVRADAGITVSGLSFDCRDCSTNAGPPCQVTLGKEHRMLSCDAAVTELLNQAVKDADTEHPSAAELRKFLLASTVPPESAKAALSLLMLNETGRRALTQDAYSFASKYGPVLATLVSNKKSESEVWMAYWKLPSQEGIQLDGALRAAILAHREELTAADLFQDLSIVDTEKDVAELKVYEAALTGSRDELAKSVKDAREYISRCVDTDNAATQSCVPETRRGLPGPVIKYLERVQVQRIVNAAATGKLSSEQILERLRQTNFKEARTPAAHDLVRDILQNAPALPYEERTKVLSEENEPMLQVFAENDKGIAGVYATALCKQAEELWEHEQVKPALHLLELSFKIVPESFEERVRLISRIGESPLYQNDTALQDQFLSVVEAHKPPDPEVFRKRLLGVFAILAGLSFLWMIAVYTFKQRKYAAEQAALEMERDEAELMVLLEFFGLTENDTVQELARRYRKKAKETHPDMQRSGSAEFQDLLEKYQRARELMLKYSVDETSEPFDETVDEDGEESASED
ncbi:MAG: J domain-containing protein [Bdellovibrionota bacterium]